jgi:hypothetical protein
MESLSQEDLAIVVRSAALSATTDEKIAAKIVNAMARSAALSKNMKVTVTVELHTHAPSDASVKLDGLPCLACVCVTIPFVGTVCTCAAPPGASC